MEIQLVWCKVSETGHAEPGRAGSDNSEPCRSLRSTRRPSDDGLVDDGIPVRASGSCIWRTDENGVTSGPVENIRHVTTCDLSYCQMSAPSNVRQLQVEYRNIGLLMTLKTT